MPHYLNIEINTTCNFHCAYCYRENYDDAVMSFDRFQAIVDPYLQGNLQPAVYRLVGEGEPLLHPQFWDFVRYLKDNGAAHVETVSNGSLLSVKQQQYVVAYLDSIHISLDTTDPVLAERIGRHNVARVMRHIRQLAARGYKQITLFTVAFGQDYRDVVDFAAELGIKHEFQPLQTKSDYASRYTMFEQTEVLYPQHITAVECTYLGRMAHYNIEGVKMPCCFIKDFALYPGYQSLLEQLPAAVVPDCCQGCKFLKVLS